MLEKENKILEYKEEINRTYLKTVCAYANYNDGMVIFGVSDDYVIKGIKSPKEECLNIENQINDSIKPKPNFSIKVNNDNTITLEVFKGDETPYRYNGKCYKRNDTSTVEVNPLEENRLVLEGMNISYEELTSKRQDLSFDILGKNIKEALNLDTFNQDTLKSLNLLNQKGYNNAAQLLADSNNYPGFDVVIFGRNINEIKKRYSLVNTSILKQYLDILEIFKNEYIIQKIDGGFREKYELIPFEAFREAIANSIIHRTWDININTKVEMYLDKIVISSPGGLPNGISKEAFINGRFSYLRNPIIGNVFHRLNIVELFATGVKRINESYRNCGVRPLFDISNSYISITLPVKREISFNNNEKNVLSKMKNNFDYTRTKLEELTSLNKDALIRALNKLIDKNVIVKKGRAKQTYYQRTL